MKSLFKFLFIFSALATSFLITPGSLNAQETNSVNYIQNTKFETVVLVSNNILNTEIYSNNEESTQSSIGSNPLLIAFIPKEDYFIKNKAQLMGSFIHNLSTNIKETKQIRAP